MNALHAVVDGLLPPLCAACGRGCPREGPLCVLCRHRLAALGPLSGSGPAGVDRAWSSAAHQGVARDLVVALKFRRLQRVAGLMAARIEWLAPTGILSGTIVPVPTAPLRSLVRGFDPAFEIAAELSSVTCLPLREALSRRGAGRQVGRRRAQRTGDPPRLRTVGEAPRSVVLVDDVLTTGATLSAAAAVLRHSGALRVDAITFTRRP